MAPHSSTLAWKIPWMEEPDRLQSRELLRVGHDWTTSLSLFTFMHWRRKWQPTPVFLPGESQGRGSLVGCHLWGRTESDTTGVTTVDGTRCHDLSFLNDEFYTNFFTLLFHQETLALLCFLPEEWCYLHIWGYWYFSRQSWFQLVFLPVQCLNSKWGGNNYVGFSMAHSMEINIRKN